MTETRGQTGAPGATRKTRSDGVRSRASILQAAAQLATVEGIDGLSIGRLAETVGMSKSGLYAHFGSKQELQLATIDAAEELFDAHVVEPATHSGAGLARLRALTENYLRYVEARVFVGGCFFAALVAEVDAREGPVRERAAQFMVDWMQRLTSAIRDAQAAGEIRSSEDPDQLAFELEALLLLANAQFVLANDPAPIERARVASARRLAAAAS